MAKLKMLPPRIATLSGRLDVVRRQRHGSAGKRLTGKAWTQMRRRILEQQPLCVLCERAGRTQIAEEIDHVIPLERGGTYEPQNLMPVCRACHREKTAREREGEK